MLQKNFQFDGLVPKSETSVPIEVKFWPAINQTSHPC